MHRRLPCNGPTPAHLTFALLAALAAPLGAQSDGDAIETAPVEDGSLTIVARYGIDPVALEGAMSSAELAGALRDHLVGEFAMPLDERLQVDLQGEIADPVHGGSYFFGYSALGALVPGGRSIGGPLAAVIRDAHGPGSAFDDDEWDEDAAWGELEEAIVSGLTRSLAALNTDFAEDADGRVPLRVAAVHTIPTDDYEFQEGLERLFLRLDPSPRFGSSVMADWEPPEGLAYATQSVLIELEPVVVEAAEPEIEAVTLSVAELDRLVGDYTNADMGALSVTRVGEELYARPDDPDEEALALVPTSPTEFVVPSGGGASFVFAIGADGTAETVTISQGAMSLVFARRP
jgi:hypothetical protein